MPIVHAATVTFPLPLSDVKESMTANDATRGSKKRNKLPGFSRKGLPKKWCNKDTYDFVCTYLSNHKMRLDKGELCKYTKWKSTTKVKIWCQNCETSSSATCLNSLQSGWGIACFCSGKMPVSSCQYYDTVMNNRELCEELESYTAFHREVAPIEKPSFEEWEVAAKKGCRATGLLTLTCSRCKTSSDATCLNNLQGGQGIACGCVNKTERQVWFPELCRQAFEDGYEVLCDTSGQYQPDHLRTQPQDQHLLEGHVSLSRRKFDGGLRILPTGTKTSTECDGQQHFKDVAKFKTTACENQRIDGAKIRSGFEVGEWNIRYYQEGVWTGSYQWRTFMRNAHAYIAAAGPEAAPR